jgi:hypothetical protein
MSDYEEKTMTVDELAARVLAQTQERLRRMYPSSPQWEWERVEVIAGPKYTRIDRGPEHNKSGMLMIENETGTVFGIKGYGRVHRGHCYGTLDTAGEWYWGNYYPEPIADARRLGHLPGPADAELFARTAPRWNCVDFPGEGMHYTPGTSGCAWCGKGREEIAAEHRRLEEQAAPAATGSGCRHCAGGAS